MIKLFRLLFLITVLGSCDNGGSVKTMSWTSRQEGAPPLAVIENHFEKPETTLNISGDTVQFYKQKVNGFEIHGSYGKLIKNREGHVTYLTTKYVSDEKRLSNRADQLSQKIPDLLKRLKLKYYQLSKAYKILEPRVIFLADGTSSKPLYLLDWIDQSGEEGHRWFLDKNLLIFRKIKTKSEFSGRGLVYPKGPRLSSIDHVGFNDLIGNGLLQTSQIKVTTRADKQASSEDQVFEYKEDDVRFAQVQVFHFAQNAIELFQNKWNLKFPENVELVTHIGFPQKKSVMFYFSGTINLGEGDELTYRNILLDPTIVTHELMHLYLEKVIGLNQGSVNEAFADYLSCSLLDNPLLGEVSYLKKPYTRSLEQGKKWSELNGGTYNDSLVLSSLLWQVRKIMGAKKADDFAFKIMIRLAPDATVEEIPLIIESFVVDFFSPEELKQFYDILISNEWRLSDI